jgi:hypothetical protein
MKHHASLGIMIILLMWLSSSCREKFDPNFHHYVFFVNDSDQHLYVGKTMSSSSLVYAHSADSVCRFGNITIMEELFNHGGTSYDDYDEEEFFQICVFDEVSYPNYPEKERFAYYELHTILTWEITLSDLRRLNWRLTFPPTENMKDLTMTPSYEEIIAKYGAGD